MRHIFETLARQQPFESIFSHLLAFYFTITRFGRQFTYNGKRYPYLYHPYNVTYFGERTVEIPIFLDILKKSKVKRVLEVGNVLSHYTDTTHDVVDKYEKNRGVINADIVRFNPKKKYDVILSISTLEHIGWDERPKDPGKILKAIKHLKTLLTPDGHMIVSLPLGYNPHVDRLYKQGKLEFSNYSYLKRISKENEWRQVTKKELEDIRYNSPYPYANGLIVAAFRK